MDGMLFYTENVLEVKNIFERYQMNLKTPDFVVIIYHFGISLRKASLVISSFGEVYHETLQDLYLLAGDIF